MSPVPFLITQGWLGYFLPVKRSERAKNPILPSWKIFHERVTPNFSHIKIDPKTLLWCIFRQFKEGVFEKNALLCSPISAQKRPFLVSWGAIFGQKTWKIKCFQFIQSKISQFVTQMWLPKKLQFLVPGTPLTPPYPPNTPQGSGGAKNGQNAFPQVQWW